MDATPHPAVTLGALWLPVVLSGAVLFIASALVWTASHIHDKDWKVVPDEAGLLEALRKQGLAPGQYLFPHMDPRALDRAAAQRTWETRRAVGPVGALQIGRAGRMSMGPMMAKMVVYFIVVSLFVAYVARLGLPHGASYMEVFRFVGATGFLAYGASQVPDSIWFHRSWRTTWITLFDAFVYGCLTAGVFGWLWPR